MGSLIKFLLMLSCKFLSLLPFLLFFLLFGQLVHISLHFIIEILLLLLFMLNECCIVSLVSNTLDTLLKFLPIFRSDAPLKVLFWVNCGSKGTLSHSQIIACRLECIMVDTIVCHGICSIKHVGRLLESEGDCTIEFIAASYVT